MTAFAISLRSANRPTATVILASNEHGELPAVVVDPRDISGCVVPGMWLQSEHDRSAYVRVKEAGH